jgi:hypothetical protein
MAVFPGSRPSRSYEPLALRMCKAIHDIMEGKHSVWVSLAAVSKHLKVSDAEMLQGAMSHAAQRGWVMIGGHPAHSLMLVAAGERAMLVKK